MKNVKIKYNDFMFITNPKINSSKISGIDFDSFRDFINEISQIKNDHQDKKIYFYNNESENSEEITNLSYNEDIKSLSSKCFKYYEDNNSIKVILSSITNQCPDSAYLLDKNTKKTYVIGENKWFAIEDSNKKICLRTDNLKNIFLFENGIRKTFVGNCVQVENHNVLENIHFTTSGETRIDFKNAHLDYIVLDNSNNISKFEKNTQVISQLLFESSGNPTTKKEKEIYDNQLKEILKLERIPLYNRMKEITEFLFLMSDNKKNVSILSDLDIKKISESHLNKYLKIEDKESFLNIYNTFFAPISNFLKGDIQNFNGSLIKSFILEDTYDIKDFNLENFKKLEDLIVLENKYIKNVNKLNKQEIS